MSKLQVIGMAIIALLIAKFFTVTKPAAKAASAASNSRPASS